MPDYQPIDYRLRCHTKRTDLPADVLRDIGEAYAEIERLRKELDTRIAMCDMRSEKIIELTNERDEARRPYCIAFQEITENLGEKNTTESIVEEMGWDCYKENTNEPWSAEKYDAIARHIENTVNEIMENTRKAVPQKIDLFKENTND